MKAISIPPLTFLFVALTWTLHGAGEAYGQETGELPRTPLKPTLPSGTAAEQTQVLIKQYEKAVTAFRKLYEAAKTEEEEAKLAPLCPDSDLYATLLVQIAEKNPKDAAAVDALLWALRQGGLPSLRARTILTRDHLLNPKIGPLCMALRHQFRDATTVGIIRRVLENNPGKEAQAQAAFSMAKVLQSRAEWVRSLRKADPKELPEWEKTFGKEVIADLKRADPAALDKESEELLERITKEKDYAATVIAYGDAQVKLGDLVGWDLFQFRHLQPGKVAPDIVGEDIDGKPMKLSDYRGKVVLLDFWGHW